ncbi:hypothetical protein V8F20_010812 [Naviculisporaceae sp. PSN 640]
MKILSLASALLWTAIVGAHNGNVPKDSDNAGVYTPSRDMGTSPVPRGIFGSRVLGSSGANLQKRQCAGGDIYCTLFDKCCISGYSCCNYNFCCPPGYICPVSGPCVQGSVYTSTYTTYYWVTSNIVSTVYDESTSWDYVTTTSWAVETSHVQGGTQTETVWVTVTRNQKRSPLTVPTPTPTPRPAPDLPTFLEGQTPVGELLLRGLVDIGLINKRQAVTSYVTVVLTTTTYRVSYTTVDDVVTKTSTSEVEATTTTTIVDNAAATETVTSTTTYIAGSPQNDNTNSNGNSNGNSNTNTINVNTSGGGLSRASIIGIAVSVGCSVVGLVFAVGWRVWKYRRQRALGRI